MEYIFLKEISESLKIIAEQGNKPFYFTQEFWTASATLTALFVPLIIIWLSNKPKKSLLVPKGLSIVNQDRADDDSEKNQRRLLNVGRLILENKGKYKAKSVEVYLEQIVSNGEVRKDFFPIPLKWTHGQLNKSGVTVRDVYPNQTVYLDIFNHIYDDSFVGDHIVKFAVAAGNDVVNLSRVATGESEVFIKIYQESGQVFPIHLKIDWDVRTVPKLSII